MNAARASFGAAVLLAAGALVAGVVLAVSADDSSSAPTDVVRDYFAALARSDAPTALALGQPASGSHAYLTSEVLRVQQQLAPLHDVTVDAAAGSGDARTVHYSYVLDFADSPRTITGDVQVARTSAGWRLASAAVPVQLDLEAATSRATLAGTALPDTTVALFPGAVPIRFDTSELALDDGNVTFGSTADLPLEVVVSASGQRAVTAAVETLSRSCFAADRTAAPGCPMPDDIRVVPGSLHGTASPATQLHVAVESLASGLIHVTGSLPFRGTYERLDDDNIARRTQGALSLRLVATTPSVGNVRLQLLADGS